MKITEETRIKDLIPKRYEFVNMNLSVDYFVKEDTRILKFDVKVQRKPKDFNEYVMRYLDSVMKDFDEDNTSSFAWFFTNKKYGAVPFEIRVGLLKFICDDLDVRFFKFVDHLYMRYDRMVVGLDDILYKDVIKVCPEEFLKSIV